MTDDDFPGWIKLLARASALIGMNPTQTRWRLTRWNENRKLPKSERRVSAQPVDQQGNSVMTVGLALVILAAFARQWIAQGGGLGAPTGHQLFVFGAHDPADAPGEWWRLYTAALLHIGVLHLAFNLIALSSVGPQIEQLWGHTTMLFIFFATAVAGNLVSQAFMPIAISAGASGGLSGLIGAAAGWGQRQNTSHGREVRNRMLGWLAYTIIIGFGIHANNWAHAGGAIAGALFGFAVRPAAWKKLRALRTILGVIAIVATLAALAWILAQHDPGHQYTIDWQKYGCSITRRC